MNVTGEIDEQQIDEIYRKAMEADRAANQRLLDALHAADADGALVTIYEVHTFPGGPGACVGPENMRAEIKPEVGQQWLSTAGRTLTVGAFDTSDAPTGLIAIDQGNPRRRITLTAPHWALIVSGPHPRMRDGAHCDIGGERLTDPWWLLKAARRDWEHEYGAACAKHAGQLPQPLLMC